MENLIIIGAVLLIIELAAFYIYIEKKKGKKCIGCPESGNGCCHCKNK